LGFRPYFSSFCQSAGETTSFGLTARPMQQEEGRGTADRGAAAQFEHRDQRAKKECPMRALRIGRANLAISAILVATVAGWTSYSIGQQRAAAAPRKDGAHRVDHFDHHVAQCLIMGNQNEVAAAKIAQKKASNDEVKNFADNMMMDHEKFIADLDKFAGHNYRHRDAGGRASSSDKQTTAESRTAPGKDGEQHEHMAKMMKIHEEIADQCRASVQRELDSKQGKAFDECYMGLQIGAHMKMVDELTVLARHVSADFKPVLEKGLQTAQQHLKDAKQVMNDINEPQTASAKDSTTK
jgi:predicted outer membrane protein